MRRLVARCCIYGSLATVLAFLTFPTWYSIFLPPMSTDPASSDRILVVLPPGGTLSIELTVAPVTGIDETSSDTFGIGGVDALLSGNAAVLDIDGSFEEGRTGPAFVVFGGRLGAVADGCHNLFSHEVVESVKLSETPLDVAALGDSNRVDPPLISADARVLRLVPDSDRSLYVECPIDREFMWSNVRQAHYLNIPQLVVARSATRELHSGQPIDDTDLRSQFLERLPKSRDCIIVSYRLGRQERIESSDAWVAEEQVVDVPYVRSWKSCGVSMATFPDSSSIKVSESKELHWVWTTGGLDRLIVTDIAQEGLTERDLFVGGLALGLIGALMVEILALLIQLAERQAGFIVQGTGTVLDRLEKRWRSRPEGRREYEQLSLW